MRLIILLAGLLFGVPAMAQSWLPTGTAPLVATTSSGNVALPVADPSENLLVTNGGAVNAWILLGDATVVATTARPSTLVQAGKSVWLPIRAATYVAAVTGSSTAALTLTTGYGVPMVIAAGGGSGGGGCPGLMLFPPPSVAAGTSGTFSGAYCGTAPTGIDYSLNGGATYTASSTPTISGNLFSFSLTAPGGGTYTVYTREEPGTTVVSNPQTWVVTSSGCSNALDFSAACNSQYLAGVM